MARRPRRHGTGRSRGDAHRRGRGLSAGTGPDRAPAPGAPDLPADALRRARSRRPLCLDGVAVGAVAVDDVPLLHALAAPLHDDGCALHWQAARGGPSSAALTRLNAALREAGRVTGWRDEPFALFTGARHGDPARLSAWCALERAACRFWGLLTLGAHATGYVTADGTPDGRPAALWIARRAATKATDPGRRDNLVGGGVPLGQTPQQALWREAREEAGVGAALSSVARPAGVLRLHRDLPEGLQHEWLHAFDLPLPPDFEPANQDGEVAGFERMTPAHAMDCARSGEMTLDAALVTLDFGLRHGVLRDPALVRALQPLRVVRTG